MTVHCKRSCIAAALLLAVIWSLLVGSAQASALAPSWTESSPGTSDMIADVAYGNGCYIAVTYENGNIYKSTDNGQTWDLKATLSENVGYIAFGNNTFVATDNNKEYVYYSQNDGENWTPAEVGAGATSLTGIAYGDDGFVAVGCLSSSYGNIYTSSNGFNGWNQVFSDIDPNGVSGLAFANVGYGDGTYVAVGSNGVIYYSVDTQNWMLASVPNADYYKAVAYHNGLFMAASDSGRIVTSGDGGATWTQVFANNAYGFNDIVVCDGFYLAVANGGKAVISFNGNTWADEVTGTSVDLWGAAYANGKTIVAGSNGTILVREPGRENGVDSVAGQTVTSGSEAGTWSEPKTATITVPYSTTSVLEADIHPKNNDATVYLFSDDQFINDADSIPLTAGGSTTIYVQIDEAGVSATTFYAIIIQREAPPPEEIGAATVNITAPIAGVTPQTGAGVQDATNDNDFEVTGITWNATLTPGLKFKAGTVYTATVTLQSKNGKAFQADSFTPVVSEASLVGTTTTTGTEIGNTVTFLVTFPVTDTLTLTGIAVTFDPIHMNYTEEDDDILDLSGMVVTETYNDGTTDTVAFADGTAAGYITSPANGTVLTYASHDLTTVTVTHISSGLTAQTISLSINPALTHEISLTPEEGGTFPSEVVGYTESPTKNVTVTNIGTGTSGELFIELEGTNKDDFQTSIISISGLLVSGSESFTVWPKEELPVGTYTATVKVSGVRAATQSFDVSFTVEHSYGISLDPNKSYDFPQATVGYGAQTPLTVEVSNTCTGSTGPMTVSLEGLNPDDFELSVTSLGNLAPESSTTFTVVPKTGLAQGMYDATVTVSGAAVGSEEFDISFVVLPIFSIELDPADTYTFPAAIVGYGEQTPRSFTVNNTGTYETFDLTVALEGGEDSNFELSTTTIPSIEVSDSASFTVVPKTGLAIGTYTEKVTVSGDYGMEQSVDISFTVDPEPTHIIALNPTGNYVFSVATVGYGAQTAYQVTVNSTGTGDSGALTVALSGTNADAFELNKTAISAIAPLGSDSFTVAPKTGLAQGDYSATVTVSGGSVTSRSFDISFTVEPSYIIALNPAVDYTFPEATAGYGAQTAYSVTVSSTGTGATGALAIALGGADADAFELSKTTIVSIAASSSDSFTVVPKTGLAADTYTATVTVSGSRVEQKSINITFKVNYVMNEGTLTEVVSPTTTIIAEGQFAQEARLIVTPLDEGDDDRDDLEGQASEKNAIAAYEVHVEPAEAFLPPLSLTFQVGEKYNGHTVYILHKLGNENIDIYQPTVVNGEAVIIVQELSPFLLAIDPAVIIAQQPQSVTALIGTTATFSVVVEGLEPFTYRWQRRTSTNGQWKDIAGVTGSSYTTTTLSKSHNGYAYRVIVTDVLSNSATSDVAVLTVTASPQTGDASHPLAYAALTVIFAAAAIMMLKKRKPA